MPINLGGATPEESATNLVAFLRKNQLTFINENAVELVTYGIRTKLTYPLSDGNVHACPIAAAYNVLHPSILFYNGRYRQYAEELGIPTQHAHAIADAADARWPINEEVGKIIRALAEPLSADTVKGSTRK